MATNLEYHRKWRAANRERNRELQRKSAAKRRSTPQGRARLAEVNRAHWARRRAAVLVLLGGKCVWCGFSDPRALQVDHVNGGGRQEFRELGSHRIYRKILAEAPGYQLLCANCNMIKGDPLAARN